MAENKDFPNVMQSLNELMEKVKNLINKEPEKPELEHKEGDAPEPPEEDAPETLEGDSPKEGDAPEGEAPKEGDAPEVVLEKQKLSDEMNTSEGTQAVKEMKGGSYMFNNLVSTLSNTNLDRESKYNDIINNINGMKQVAERLSVYEQNKPNTSLKRYINNYNEKYKLSAAEAMNYFN